MIESRVGRIGTLKKREQRKVKRVNEWKNKWVHTTRWRTLERQLRSCSMSGASVLPQTAHTRITAAKIKCNGNGDGKEKEKRKKLE